MALNWLKFKNKSEELPHYSRLKSTPSAGLPPELQEKEQSNSYKARRDLLERGLLEPNRRPPDSVPLFTELLAANEGVVTISLPESGGQCFPIFSTPFSAADYVRTLLGKHFRVQYLSSSPSQLVGILHDLRERGVDSFTIDRCPRCSVFTTIGSSSVKEAADAVKTWAIFTATKRARADLYFEHALDCAKTGQLEVARDVALESIGHVSFEDPRPHLLLGQLALQLGDKTLLREAKAFLQFFKLEQWERKLLQTVQSDQPDFEFPE